MIRILKKPNHTTRMKFSCLCGCIFTTDLYEYETSYDFFNRPIYIITCPYCKVKREYLNKDVELIHKSEEEELIEYFQKEDTK